MTILRAVHLVLVLAVTIRVLLRDDLAPTVRLAWFVVLYVLPIIGSAVYFLFGEVDLGNKANKQHNKIFDAIRSKGGAFMGSETNVSTLIDPLYLSAFNYALSTSALGKERSELDHLRLCQPVKITHLSPKSLGA